MMGQVMLGPVRPLFQTLFQVAGDFVGLTASAMRSRAQLIAKKGDVRVTLSIQAIAQ
jgi:hypothetical protein